MYGDFKYGENRLFTITKPAKENIEKYLTNLIEYMPSYYQSGTNIKKLLKILDTELGEVNYYANTLGEQSIIKKATWGMRTWEKELDIGYNPSMALEERREVALAKVRGRGATTKAMLINVAEAFSGGEVDVIEFPDEHYFIIKFVGVKGIPKNMQGFIDMIDLIKPAHLEYIFKYTYTTCQMLINWDVDCNEAMTMTCKELKTYEKEVI